MTQPQTDSLPPREHHPKLSTELSSSTASSEDPNPPSQSTSTNPPMRLTESPTSTLSSSPIPPLLPTQTTPQSKSIQLPGASPNSSPRPSTQRRSSQIPTRPAPASPGPSRPNSQILRRESTSSQSQTSSQSVSQSINVALNKKIRPRSSLGMGSLLPSDQDHFGHQDQDHSTPEIPSSSSTQVDSGTISRDTDTEEHIPKLNVGQSLIVRDYGYLPTDPKFKGIHPPPEPSPSSELSDNNRGEKEWSWDNSGSGSGGNDSERKSWGGFGLLGWRGFAKRATGSGKRKDEDDEEDPEGEDDYAFSSGSEALEGDYRVNVTEDQDDHGEGDVSRDDEGIEITSGWYRAAYAFDAIGNHEMSLEEGDIVRVRGGGVGDGWVVGIKYKKGKLPASIGAGGNEEDEEDEGLVPEGYLERLQEGELNTEGQTGPVEEGRSRDD